MARYDVWRWEAGLCTTRVFRETQTKDCKTSHYVMYPGEYGDSGGLCPTRVYSCGEEGGYPLKYPATGRGSHQGLQDNTLGSIQGCAVKADGGLCLVKC